MPMSFKSKKSAKTKEPEEISWILEGIVGFLRSPVWTVPIMNFVESNCASFENKEENKFEYTDIHNNYKTLVEQLIAEYLKELSISEEEFSSACKKGKSSFKNLEGMFEYIWAADDFLLFKRIMATHNLEIEMQAISIMQGSDMGYVVDSPPLNPDYPNPEKGDFHYADEKKVPLPTSDDSMQHILSQSKDEYSAVMKHLTEMQQREESDLQRAIQFSKQEMERLNAQAAEEKRMLDEAIRLSLESMKQSSSQEAEVATTVVTAAHPEPHTKARDSDSMPSTSKEQDTRKKLRKTKTDLEIKTHSSLPPLQKPHSSSEAAADWIASAQKESMSTATSSSAKLKKEFPEHLLSKQSGVDPEELAKRKAYLQNQREKLLEAKRKKREGELKEYQSESSSKTSSASSKSSSVDDTEEKEKMLKARRALAERLKREVIEKDT